jgi:tetraacyldisaccharide 4'-kinase
VLLLRILLLPFTMLYACGILIRNFLYNSGILNRTRFDFPVVCVGNLSAGGTGKTPFIEMLLREFGSEVTMGVLSRGYMRKTSGYVFADEKASPATIGDEPFLLHSLHPGAAVAVCENRVIGIPSLLGDAPGTGLIVMDDGFQHLPVEAGFNILLTARDHLYTRDYLLPSGRLREFRSGAQRAQLIVVTKCEPSISITEQQELIREIAPLPAQEVLFAANFYDENLRPVFAGTPLPPQEYRGSVHALGFSGLADASHFESYINGFSARAKFERFADHAAYSETALRELASAFNAIHSENKILVTTLKDAVKLQCHPHADLIRNLPVYYVNMHMQLLGDARQRLHDKLTQFINSYSNHDD